MMIETITVKDFLRTGNFGEFKEIYFGMPRNKLVEVVGDAEWQHFYSKKSKFPSIYKYGKVEFYFEENEVGRLNGIQIIPTIQEAALKKLSINYDFIKPELDYNSIKKYLHLESIGYKTIKSEYDNDDVVRIETEGGVQIIFSKSFGESILIHKVSKFVTLNLNQEKEKQVSFSISESAYQKLRTLANTKGKTISAICKKIILEELKK